MNKKQTMIALIGVFVWISAASADLVGWWRFDEGAGIVAADSSGHGLDASIEGAIWAEGQSGSALEFNGTDSLVRIPEYTTGLVKTVAMWIKIDEVQDGQKQMFNGNGPPHMNFELATGQIEGRVYTGSGNITLTGPEVSVGVWTHVAWVWDFTANRSELYIDGESVALGEASNTLEHASESIIGRHPSATTASFLGAIDEVRVYDHALDLGEIQAAMRGSAALSSSPNPKNDTTDVLRDHVLSWKSGQFAAKHNVYFGTTFEDVNSATVATLSDLDVNSFDPGRLEFGTSYFWRVDEVNGTPDKTVYRGDVWRFEVEPYSIEIPGAAIAVTASSSSNEFSVPQKTLDGSGLGADGSHTIAPDTMWFTASVDLDPWIQYEFSDVQKLDSMKVWNSNSAAEMAIGWGVKDVVIEYSVDGENWDMLEEVSQFSRASGSPTYSQYDEVDLGGLAAKYVRLNIQSNWGGILMSYSLSEVQFYMIPAAARTPEPASGSVDIAPNAAIGWRAGRDVAQHVITISTDVNAVIDGLADSVTSSTNSLDLTSLDPQLGQTYHWRVDEVNEAEAVSVWAGPVWRFSTVAALTVDDFESYSNISPDRPFQTWLDGFGYSADEFFPAGYGGNGTGAGIGHDIWSLSSPHYGGDIMEGTIVKSGQLSMPLYFNNTNGLTVSETERTFDSPQDWTAHGIKSLSLNIYGDPDNSGQLYLKINGTRVNYDGLSDALQRRQWIPWNIDLSGVAGNLQNVTSMAIGVEGAGATGLIYVDAIRLYALMPDMINPVVPDDSDPNLFAYYAFEGNANDSVGANHGTTNGDPGYAAGKIGQAMTFDGTDDYVLLTFDQEEVWPAYAVSLWTRTDIFGQVQYRSVFNNSSSDPDFQIDVDGSDPGVYRYWGTQAGATLGPVTSDWAHLAASCDGTETKVYYNGLWVDTLDAVDTNFGRLGIGINRGTNQPFAGSIDDVRVYNRSLSYAEIAGLAGLTDPIPVSF